MFCWETNSCFPHRFRVMKYSSCYHDISSISNVLCSIILSGSCPLFDLYFVFHAILFVVIIQYTSAECRYKATRYCIYIKCTISTAVVDLVSIGETHFQSFAISHFSFLFNAEIDSIALLCFYLAGNMGWVRLAWWLKWHCREMDSGKRSNARKMILYLSQHEVPSTVWRWV